MDNYQVKKDLLLAKQVIEHGNNNFGFDFNFLNIYSFSNENLSGYLRNNNYHNKSVLTVGSSTDQILNLINYNCQNITLVDINPFVKYYYELKKAAILGLNNQEYLNFFCNNSDIFFSSSKMFNKQIYKKISKYLSDDTKLFWECLFAEYKPHILKQSLFIWGELPRDILIKNNDYLQTDNFNLLKQKIINTEISFICTNIEDYNFPKEQYDYILLSNIFDYLFNLSIVSQSKETPVLHPSIQIKYLTLLKKIIISLKENGQLLFNYRWDITNHNSISHQAVDNLLMTQSGFSNINFPGASNSHLEFDSIYTYIKK